MFTFLTNFELYGFAFGQAFDKINFDEVYENLYLRHVLLEDVIFSTLKDDINDIFWVIAGTRYIEEVEIVELLDFLIDNSMEEQYLLIENIY